MARNNNNGHFPTEEELVAEREAQEALDSQFVTTELQQVTAGSVAIQNLEWRHKYRMIASDQKLPWRAVRIVPIIKVIHEEQPGPRGEALKFPYEILDATSSQFTLRRGVLGDDNKTASKNFPVTIKIPSKTTAGAHIDAQFTSEDLVRAILLDPNWTKSYYIIPMSEADIERDEELERDALVRRYMAERKQVQENARSGIVRANLANISMGA